MNPQRLPRFRPWIYFGIFLAANTLLSYFSFSLEAKLWIGLFGILLPFGFAFFYLPSQSDSKDLLQKEFLPPVPFWVWIFLALGAVFLRFFQLTTLSVWPHYDEGVYGYYALNLDEHWTWRLFYGGSRVPPFYIWGLALFLKIFGSSLLSLWIFPAFISLAAIPLAYGASRQYFSRSLAFCVTAFTALGFWPALLGRFSFMTGLVLTWEALVLWLLGLALKSRHAEDRKRAGAMLGAATGLGFWIHIHWPIVAAVVFLTLVLAWLKPRAGPDERAAFFWFLGPCALLGLPIVIGVFLDGYGRFVLGLVSHGDFSASNQWAVSLSYLSSLFWGMDPRFHTYQPVWGGLLNPLLGSLFLLGLLESWKRRKEGLYRWLLACLIFFVLPAMATSDRETFRMVPVIPILFGMASLGMAAWLGRFPKNRAMAVVLGLLLLSGSLDSFHLYGIYGRLWNDVDNWRGWAKSIERYRAYGLLEKIKEEQGPGVIFSDFVPGLPDQTLTVASYSYNAAQNPALHASDAHWVAFLANVNDRPFLARRFPQAKAYVLSPAPLPPDGGWMLWVCPTDSFGPKLLEQYGKASASLKPFIDKSLGRLSGEDGEETLQALREAYPFFKTDPFLNSFYWEKMSDLYLKFSFEARVEDRGKLLEEAREALEQAVRGEVPSAHLYFHLGALELMEQHPQEARRAFEKAMRAPLNLTQAAGYLSP